ncbi:hypothetical protein QUF75_18105 [Desulfococcaceae bacterium HSG7]|nr:hypothetical protein [Desulfococcaceae bacterium HSG7]
MEAVGEQTNSTAAWKAYHDSKRSDKDSLSSAVILSRRGRLEGGGHRCDCASVIIFRKRGSGGGI